MWHGGGCRLGCPINSLCRGHSDPRKLRRVVPKPPLILSVTLSKQLHLSVYSEQEIAMRVQKTVHPEREQAHVANPARASVVAVPSAQAPGPEQGSNGAHTAYVIQARCQCGLGTGHIHPLRLPSPASCGASNNNTLILMPPGAWGVHFFPNIKMPSHLKQHSVLSSEVFQGH